MSDETREQIANFQQVQQQIQVLLMQKQNLQIQSAEMENALREIEIAKEKEAFEIVGNIMIKKKKEDLIKQLKEKKEMIDLRISTIDKQYEKHNAKAVELQKKLSTTIPEQ